MSRDRETDAESGANADSGDDFHAEVSDLRPNGTAITPPSAAPHSPLAPRRTLRQRLTGLTITLCVLAVAVSLLWRASAGLRPAGSLVQPTGIAGPASTNLFYLLPNPSGVVVSLDGHPLARLPAPGDPDPLRLDPGSHSFVWTSKLLPFRQVACRVSVPALAQDTCPFVPLDSLPVTMRALPGKVIAMRASLVTMEPGPASALSQTILQALDDSAATVEVQPGESYYTAGSPGSPKGPHVAQQPMKATLHYEWLPNNAYFEPCILAEYAILCRFPGQDCGQLCTVAAPAWRLPPASDATSGTEWDVATVVTAGWSYTTLGGLLVTTSAENLGIQLLALRIIWDGAAWHVTPIFGHTPGFDVADDPVCDPARYWLSQTTWDFMLNDPPGNEQVLFASGANPADGCVVVLTHGQPPAIFLERFGLLLTVNDTAVNPNDNLPAADAAEQAIANRLMAQLQPS